MNRYLFLIGIILGTSGALFQSSWAGTGWRLFRSDSFEVAYPRSWSRIAPLADQLDVLSPGHRVEGVVIGKGQAEIEVSVLPHKLAINDQIKEWSKASDRLVRRSKVNGLRSPACPSFEGAAVDNNEGDNGHQAFDRTVAFFCNGSERQLLVTVRYWLDDPKAAEHQQIARRVAASLRSR
jgi:hypothetical protein